MAARREGLRIGVSPNSQIFILSGTTLMRRANSACDIPVAEPCLADALPKQFTHGCLLSLENYTLFLGL